MSIAHRVLVDAAKLRVPHNEVGRVLPCMEIGGGRGRGLPG